MRTGVRLLLVAFTLMATALAQRPGWPKELVIAEVPVESAADYAARYQPFLEYLKAKLGIPVRLFLANDYTAVQIAHAQGKVHAAFYGPGSYLDAIQKLGAPIEAFAKEDSIRSGVYYHTLIISKKGSGIRTLEDARGKDFAFTDPKSTSGYMVPMSYFCTELKIRPREYFRRVFFAGNHEAVILGVANGTIPVGATWNTGIEMARAKGLIRGLQDFEVLWRSPRIAGPPWAYRKDLPADLRILLQRAFVSFHETPEGKEWLKARGLNRFAPATDSDYDPMRKVYEALQRPECQL